LLTDMAVPEKGDGRLYEWRQDYEGRKDQIRCLSSTRLTLLTLLPAVVVRVRWLQQRDTDGQAQESLGGVQRTSWEELDEDAGRTKSTYKEIKDEEKAVYRLR